MAKRIARNGSGEGPRRAAPSGGDGGGRRGVDLDRIRGQHEELKKNSGVSYGDITFWEPREGRNTIRVLPPYSDDNLPYKEVAYHYGIVRKKALVCPRKTYNEACPICEAADDMFKTGREDDKELGKKLNSRRRYFYNIIDRDREDAGVQVFGCGVTIHRAVTGFFADPDWGDITDPEEGFDVVIERKGTDRDTEYPAINARRRPSPLVDNPDTMEELLGNLVDLDGLVKVETYEDLKLALEDPEEYMAQREEAEKKRESERGDDRRSEDREPAPAEPRRAAPARRQAAERPPEKPRLSRLEELEDEAEGLGIKWDGTPTEGNLEDWIADEKAARTPKEEPPPAEPKPAKRAARRSTAGSSGAGAGESLRDEIDRTLAERRDKRRS